MTFLLIICWDEQMIKNDEVLPKRHFILPEGACGEGISKGNLVPLGPPVGVRDPLRRGPGFLLLFSIKSKEGILCFAEKVLNGRISYLHQAPEKGSASMKKQVVLRPFYIFLSFSRTASKAFVRVASKPFACNAATPSMVVPPGEQT